MSDEQTADRRRAPDRSGTEAKASDRKPSAKARRTAARLAAVQALYQMAYAPKSIDGVLGEFVKFRFGQEIDGERYVEPEPRLFGQIVRGVAKRRSDLDGAVTGALGTGRSLETMETLLVSILRAGTWELMEQPGTHHAIIISDYVNLGHAFFGGHEPKIINGVLDRAARTLRGLEAEASGSAVETGASGPEGPPGDTQGSATGTASEGDGGVVEARASA